MDLTLGSHPRGRNISGRNIFEKINWLLLTLFIISDLLSFSVVGGEATYNLADYGSPLTTRVTIPPIWNPAIGGLDYKGRLDVHWSATLSSDSDHVTISQENAIQQGTPGDFSLMTGPDNCWGMLMNFGLVKLEQSSDLVITLRANVAHASTLAPAFAIYRGWDTSPTSTRHLTITFGQDNPLGTAGLKFLTDAYATNTDAVVKKTLTNMQPGNYEIFVTNRSNSDSYGSYVLELQTYRSGTAPQDSATVLGYCGVANNQGKTLEPPMGLCLYGTSTLLPRNLRDGRYLWSCGDESATAPMEMCYSLSDKNSKLNQEPLRLLPGHAVAARNTKVSEELAGGSGNGRVSYKVAGSSSGLKCRLARKGARVTVSTGKNQSGTCLIYAAKRASKKYNDVQTIVYSVRFE